MQFMFQVTRKMHPFIYVTWMHFVTKLKYSLTITNGNLPSGPRLVYIFEMVHIWPTTCSAIHVSSCEKVSRNPLHNITWIIHFVAKISSHSKYIIEMVYGQRFATQFMFQVDASLQKVRRNAFFIQATWIHLAKKLH